MGYSLGLGECPRFGQQNSRIYTQFMAVMPSIAFSFVCSFFIVSWVCTTCHLLIGYLVYTTHSVHDQVVFLHRAVM